VQQEEWRRSAGKVLRKRVEEYCGKGIPEEAQLFEIGWMTKEVVVSYLTCWCGKKGCHVEDNWGQGVIPNWKWEEMCWCGCKKESSAPTERKSAARVEKAVRPREAKAQQSGAWSGGPESAAERRMVRRTRKRSRAAHGQEDQKAQQERGVVERRSEEPSRC